jgi:hypothetical protein
MQKNERTNEIYPFKAIVDGVVQTIRSVSELIELKQTGSKIVQI